MCYHKYDGPCRWAERLGPLDDNQAGTRLGRSMADVVQMMVGVQEDKGDCIRTVDDVSEHERAYPRVSKPALWGLLKKYCTLLEISVVSHQNIPAYLCPENSVIFERKKSGEYFNPLSGQNFCTKKSRNYLSLQKLS